MSTIPVMFRFSDGEVTAVFPTLPDRNDSDDVTCYAHLGQHSCASWSWIAESRAATDNEATELLLELMRVYHDHSLLVIR